MFLGKNLSAQIFAEEKCREYDERSVGRAALYNEELGFMGAAKLATKAIETGKTVQEVAEEQ
jgi:aspartate ammonia-lyase